MTQVSFFSSTNLRMFFLLAWCWLANTSVGWASTPDVCQTPSAATSKPTARRTAAPPRRTSKVNLAPMLFRAENGLVKTIEQLDLRELYQAASQMYQAKKFTQAAKLYHRIVQYFPMHRHMHAAMYNLALSYEDGGQCAKAIPFYQKVYTQYAAKKQTALNAKFRAASCFNHLKQWKQAFQIYDSILQLELEPEDRVDALAYAGESLFHLKRHVEAMPLLRLAVNMHVRKLAPKGDISYAAAMAQYYHARIYDLRFRARKFQLPQDQMKLDLEYKAKNLLQALRLYLQTIELRHADWALASIYRVGEMYEQMYTDMMAAPSPKDLNPEETKLYAQLLRQKIKVLLEKALNLYQRSLRFADRLGFKSNKWKQRSKQRFQAVLAFYHKHFGSPKLQHTITTQPSSRPTSRPTALPPAKLPPPPRKK